MSIVACNAIFGVNDYQNGGTAGAGPDGTAGGAQAGGGGGAMIAATTTGAGGSGGAACDPALCPGLDTACRTRACAPECGFIDAPSATPCSDSTGMGTLCDGNGSCVECLENTDCATNLCLSGSCAPQSCLNSQLDNGEIAVDCGGPCPGCGAGTDCNDDSDCASNLCEKGNDRCAPCQVDGDNDFECSGNEYCSNGVCLSDKADGDLCVDDEECDSGDCAEDDGTCCDRRCNTNCEACLISKSGLANGTCGFVTAAGSDPDGECADQGSASCGATGMGCTGTAPQCVVYAAGAVCSPSAICFGGTSSPSASCDGQGTCTLDVPTSCVPYACNNPGTACRTSCVNAGDCHAAYYCVGISCMARLNLGANCSTDNQCLSNACVDGRCCDGNCFGNCRACDLAGSVGTCSLVVAGQDPDNECIGTCNGNGGCQ